MGTNIFFIALPTIERKSNLAIIIQKWEKEILTKCKRMLEKKTICVQGVGTGVVRRPQQLSTKSNVTKIIFFLRNATKKTHHLGT